MNTYSIDTRYETHVTVLTYKPTVSTMLDILNRHAEEVDTLPTEWEVEIEKIANEPSQHMGGILSSSPRYRWEIILTRRIK